MNTQTRAPRLYFNRRSALQVSIAALATSAAIPISGCGQNNSQANAQASSQADSQKSLQIWEANALGAPCFIKLADTNIEHARKSFALASSEIVRLENIFSLYKSDSEISRLNRDGELQNMSNDMRDILTISHTISVATNGAFDISVQPLWQLAEQLPLMKITQDGINNLWAHAFSRVDYKSIILEGTTVSFAKPDMAITLNAIAQGFITDKITQLLMQHGHKNGLVNIGEFRAFGHNNKQAWRVGIQDPRNVLDTLEIITLKNQSLATSSALGGYIGDQIHHIFDTRNPDTPHSKPEFISASVIHNNAHIADALATAFTLMDATSIRECASKFTKIQAILVRENGEVLKI